MSAKHRKRGEYVDPKEVIAAYEELDELRAKHPDIAAQVRPKDKKKTFMERLMGFYLKVRERFHKETPVRKKTYCWLCLLGPFGVHHFYSRHWIKGLIYLAISFSGITVAMAFIDWMVAYPKTPDDRGMIII